MAGFLTSSSVSLDNGSNVVNVTGSVDCSFVVSGTAVYINDMLMEGVSGTASDPSGNSTITLRNTYTGISIVGGTLVAFNTIEGLRDAIQRARELSAEFQEGVVNVNNTDTNLKTFLTVLDETTTITFNDGSTVELTPYQVLVNKVTAQKTEIDNLGYTLADFTFTSGGVLKDKKSVVRISDASPTLYKYIGSSSVPLNILAGTNPVGNPDWGVFLELSHNSFGDRNAVGAHDAIYSRKFNTVADLEAGIDATGQTINMTLLTGFEVVWLGYYVKGDGGGNSGIVKSGAHTADGGSIFSIDANTYVEANLKGEKISTRKFGAKIDSNFNASNSPTDDTQAVQNLINFLDGESYNTLYSPGGFSLVTQIVGKAGIVIEGDGQGVSYFIQKAGETVPIYTDDGTAYNLWTKNISFDCNNNVIPTAGVYLGYGGQQLGVVSGIENITVRNVVGNGAMLNGNVTKYDTMEFQNCTKRGVIFDGEGNKAYNIFGSDCGEGVAKLKGSSNMLVGGHVESGSSIGAFEIGAATVGNVIIGIKGTGTGSNVHEAIVLISAGASNYSVSDVVASVLGLANIPNGLIYDVSSGVRKIYGLNTANIVFSVPNYDGGSRTQLPYKDSIPPTLGTHKVGDWFISGVGIAGFPMGWVANNSGDAATTGTFTPMMPNAGAIIKTATTTLTRADIGKRFCNDGATAEITLTLPSVQVGDRIHFTRRNTTWKILIDPNGSQLIRPSSAGKYLSLDTDGASVTLEQMSTNSWCIVAQSGTISFES